MTPLAEAMKACEDIPPDWWPEVKYAIGGFALAGFVVVALAAAVFFLWWMFKNV